MRPHDDETYGQRSLREVSRRVREIAEKTEHRLEQQRLISQLEARLNAPQGRAKGGKERGRTYDQRIAVGLVEVQGGFAAAFESAGYKDPDPKQNASNFIRSHEILFGKDQLGIKEEAVAKRLRNTSVK